MTLSPGTRLGPYEILAPLGAGGMGEVYRARDPRLAREVAVKVLPGDFLEGEEGRARFEREAKLLASLNHPNVAVIHSFEEVFSSSLSSSSSHILVMELLEGTTLREKLASGPLPLGASLSFALQMAKGLSAAHEKGIVHRDLKPENLIVSRDGHLKILDFGLAKRTVLATGGGETSALTESKHTEPGVVMGTIGYVSPEQLKGKPADARSDLFSFGAVLYEMLSGQRAFRGDSAPETMSEILKENPPDLSVTKQNTPPALERIVRHCLEKDREQRFQSARDLAFDLESLAGASGPGRAALAAPAPGWKTLRAPGALAVALLALPLGGYLLGRRTAGFAQAPPSYRQLTYRNGTITSARFAPDGQTIVFAAAWEGGPLQLFSARLESPESRPLGYPRANLLAISSRGELAMIAGGRPQPHLITRGTVSQAALAGGAPREILEDVSYADWAPDGKSLAVVHRVGNRERLEFPVGTVLYETSGWIGHPRVSPGGGRIAFFDHPIWPDDRGSVAVVDLSGKKRTLSTGWVSEEGLAWSPDGSEVWFTVTPAGVARDLFAVSLAGRQRLVARVPGGMVLQDVFRDGRVLLTRDTERLSILCQAPGEGKERDLGWLDWSIPVDLSADGKTLLFGEQGLGGGPHYTVCLRKTDGSPVVRLGEGTPAGISPDGKWVLSVIASAPEQLVLLPTGPGEARRLDRGAIENYLSANFLPDGKRVLVCGKEPGGPPGLYVQELSGGKPRRIAEGVIRLDTLPVSPNGKVAAVLDAGQRIVLVPVEGGPPRPLAGFAEGDVPVRWSDDDSLFVAQGDLPVDIFRVDVATGRRSLAKKLAPADPAGVSKLGPIVLTPDGTYHAYGCFRVLSDLYLVEGLK